MAKVSIATATVVEESELDKKVNAIKTSAPKLTPDLKNWLAESLKVTGHRGIGRALCELAKS